MWALCTDCGLLSCGSELDVSLLGRHLEEFEDRLGSSKWMWHVASSQAGFPYAAMLMGITGAGYLITAKKADGVSGASPLEEL